ncbi:MAG TPA: hypothetical protein VM871_03680 [Flavisolibacter sp.]|nr:hypothetical protein [Flavisolibacter sp.]
MKKIITFSLVLLMAGPLFAQKTKPGPVKVASDVTTSSASKEVEGTWMYGNFSTTEYWSKSPGTYLGNAFTMAIAFVFKPNGTYEHYFTSQVTNFTGATYHQSLTKGKYTIDESTKTITLSAVSSHYKRTRGGSTEEDRDMRPDELSKKEVYTYSTGKESSGTKALYLTPRGTKSTLTFLHKAW